MINTLKLKFVYS